jgi:hypothetical protein
LKKKNAMHIGIELLAVKQKATGRTIPKKRLESDVKKTTPGALIAKSLVSIRDLLTSNKSKFISPNRIENSAMIFESFDLRNVN